MSEIVTMEEIVAEYKTMIDAGAPATDATNVMIDKYPSVFPTGKFKAANNKILRWAKKFGVNVLTTSGIMILGGRTNRANGVPKAHKNFTKLKPELVIPFESHLAVCSDAHFPVHSVKGCNRFVQMIESSGITTVLFNGDQLNNDYKGHRGIHEVYQAPFLKGVQTLCDFLEALMDAGVDKMIFVMGNHDDKPLRATDGELSFSDWWKTMVFDRTSGRAEFLASDRYYAIMKARNPKADKLSPDHYDWQFTHQQNYGQIPLSVGRKISANKISNVVTGHQHHMAVGKAPNNAMWLVDAGCLADPKLAGYKEMRHSGHPEWTPGFVTIIHGVPELWDLTNPDAWWEEYLG